MLILPRVWPKYKGELLKTGVRLMERFCLVNNLPIPDVTIIPGNKWHFGTTCCAYYRPPHIADLVKGQLPQGIVICLEVCGFPCGESQSRNWTWPGSTTDREPFGVIAHELGHHCDYLTGTKRWDYGSEYSVTVMKRSGEKPISGYCPNPAEWFAEMFRVFVTNSNLLKHVRPKTFKILREIWTPIVIEDWQTVLGRNVPARVVQTLRNKGAK